MDLLKKPQKNIAKRPNIVRLKKLPEKQNQDIVFPIFSKKESW